METRGIRIRRALYRGAYNTAPADGNGLSAPKRSSDSVVWRPATPHPAESAISSCWIVNLCFFIHLKLELLTQFPALNNENYFYLL